MSNLYEPLKVPETEPHELLLMPDRNYTSLANGSTRVMQAQ